MSKLFRYIDLNELEIDLSDLEIYINAAYLDIYMYPII